MRGFLKTRNLAAVSVLALAPLGVQGAQAATVTAFGGSSSWVKNDVRPGGTADIVDLTGAGSNLENNAPLGTGAVKLTTDNTDPAKAEVGIGVEFGAGGNFGTISDFLTTGSSLSYSFFKQSAGDLNPSAAAAIKLTVSDSSIATSGATDGYATFIYEPTWNQGGTGSAAVPTDDWVTALITGTSGIFWHTGIYGEDNMYGGPGMTLSDWNTFFNGDLASAVIVGISVGVGSYNQGQTAYFDDVKFSTQNGDVSYAYDFEAAAVPVPAALPLMLSGFGALGFFGWRKRRLAAT